MINELKIDELLGKVDSRYGLVLAGARRARQINEYAATLGLNESLGIPGPQVHTRSQHPLSIAFEELRSNKLEVSFKESPAEADERRLASGADAAAAGDAFLAPPSAAGAPEATGTEAASTEVASAGDTGEGAA
jgi:DNA-directed RNA polymerase subunit omega